MRLMLAALAYCFFATVMPTFVEAKAHLIIVYQGQTEPSLAKYEAAIAQDVVNRIGAIPGYDARLATPNGSLSQTAKNLGAEEYLVVKTAFYDDGSEIAVISSFSVRDDEPLAIGRVRLQGWTFPSSFEAASLLNAPGAVPLTNASAGAPSDGSVLMVPGGTQVVVHLTDKLSSSSASADQTFAFQAVQDVAVNGWVVIKRGATGMGTVVQTDGAGGNGHAGKLVLRFDYITGADGLKIQLSDSNTTETGEEKKGASSTATILGYAFLGLPGLFMHNMVRGHQMEIDPSTKFTIFVDHNVHVTASEQVATQPGFAK